MHRVGDFCTRFENSDIITNLDKVMVFDAMAYLVRIEIANGRGGPLGEEAIAIFGER